MQTDKPLRLFFALSCPSDLADAICNWRDSHALGGRPVAQANLHMTLAFLGNQPATAVDGLKQLADSLRVDAFLLQLDQLQMIQAIVKGAVEAIMSKPIKHSQRCDASGGK